MGLGRSTIYRWMGEGRFPLPKALSGGQVRWPLSVLEAWKNARLDARGGYSPPEPDNSGLCHPTPERPQMTTRISRTTKVQEVQDWRPPPEREGRFPDWPRGMPPEMAAAYVGLSAASLQDSAKAGDAPAPVRLTASQKVWLREDLDRWLDWKAGSKGKRRER